MEAQMDRYEGRWRWVLPLVVVLASAAVALIGYNIGVSHGIAQGAGADVDFYGWHRPWGFGFMFPLLFFVLWFVMLRGLFWGWGWGPPWAWRRRYYYPGEHEPHPMAEGAPDPWQRRFEEWHRRAHERMKENPPANES
jgi:hypothetical protein